MTDSQALLIVTIGRSREAQGINNKLKSLLCTCTQESGLETQFKHTNKSCKGRNTQCLIFTARSRHIPQLHLFFRDQNKIISTSNHIDFNAITITPSKIYFPDLFISHSEHGEDCQNFPPSISFSFSILKTEGWAGDKRDRRPPQTQNMIERCPRVCVSSDLSRFTRR